MAILGETARVIQPAHPDFDPTSADALVNAVISVVTRHPMQETELVQTLSTWAPGRVERILEGLRASARVQPVMRYGRRYWCGAAARFQ
jgi:hypothetical protein